MMKFKEWVDAKESSAFTRRRDAAAKGLMPEIPAASLHSRSTASPFEVDKLGDKGKDKDDEDKDKDEDKKGKSKKSKKKS